jgi:hypothetical protein
LLESLDDVPEFELVEPALSVAPEFDILVVPDVDEPAAPDVPEAPALPEVPVPMLPEVPVPDVPVPDVPEVPEPILPESVEPDEPEALPELPECFFDFDLECLPVCLSRAEPVPVASWSEPLCMPVAEVPLVVLPVPVLVPLWAKAKLVTVARTAAAIIDLRIVDSW